MYENFLMILAVLGHLGYSFKKYSEHPARAGSQLILFKDKFVLFDNINNIKKRNIGKYAWHGAPEAVGMYRNHNVYV